MYLYLVYDQTKHYLRHRPQLCVCSLWCLLSLAPHLVCLALCLAARESHTPPETGNNTETNTLDQPIELSFVTVTIENKHGRLTLL